MFIAAPRTFQILFYALRPGFVRTQAFTQWHFANLLTQLVFDYALVTTFGPRPLIYLIMSSFFAGSLHPLAGHFIAEHYVWDGLQQETYSYYGPLNIFAYNVRLTVPPPSFLTRVPTPLETDLTRPPPAQVGYHNEHHDFPSVAWTRLPALRALAPEFYDTIPAHPSWPMVIVNFIRDPEVGIFARIKRRPKDRSEKAQSDCPTPVSKD